MDKLDRFVAAAISIVALATVSFLSISLQNTEATGAIIALLAAASGWYFRGRVKDPS